MYTEITVTKTGQTITHTTQQYEVGLYVIINNDPSNQGSSPKEEKQYHLDLRKKVLKDKDVKLSAGTTLDYTGELPINDFIS